jgi:polysaccharide biosynthesis/export protein
MLLFFKKRILITLLLIVITLILTQQGFSTTKAKGSVYRLGSEDVVKVSILAGGEEQVEKEMVVGENGNINVPFIGKIKAAGLTMEELEKAIIKPLERDFFVNPQVHLQIKEYHSLQFFISGAVKNPGMFELEYTPTIMDLIANAGGVLKERGNLAYILRGGSGNFIDKKNLDDETFKKNISNKEPIKVDLLKLLDEGNMSENIMLQSGDTIYIPLGTKLNQTKTKIYVQGEVENPGAFDFQPGLTALSACIIAGGFDKFAAPNRAKIVRITKNGQETIDINLEKVISGDLPDLPLKPGDRIHIPESWF